MPMINQQAPEALTGRFNQSAIEAIIFGPESIDQIEVECDRLGMSRVMLVVSGSLNAAVNIEHMLIRATGDRVISTFADGRPGVPHDVVLAAADVARRARVNGIISVGGGSAVDLAKAVTLSLAEDVHEREDLVRYRVQFEYPDKILIPPLIRPTIPHISVSTTLSAAECTNIIGITDTVVQSKGLYIGRDLVPRVIIHDPKLSANTPRPLWASTGVRAIDHAVESLCSSNSQPLTDVLCADALARLARYLPPSYRDPVDFHAAGQCQMGALESIYGLANVKLGLSHAIGHQLGARCGVPHGVTSCVMLPAVLDYNLKYTRQQQTQIARIFEDNAGITAASGGGASHSVRTFIESLGLPARLRDVGVNASEFPAVAADVMADVIVASNPRNVGVDDVIRVLEKSY